jgi:DNA primase
MPAKRMFRCFSSGNAGDVFRFVQLRENVSFAEAVEMVASRFNIPVEYEKTLACKVRPYGRKSLLDLQELACEFFVENFRSFGENGEKIRRYWTEKRKFSLQAAGENGIGFGGYDGRILMKKMLDAKFPFAAIVASGIFSCKENETDPHRCISRLNSRLTIPIHDIQGRIVGFSARFIDGISHPSDFPGAKYVNSPDTDIFHKGSLLFGLHRARQCLAPNGEIWMVEGQFDAMRCWENGINTAIAPQGTAITPAQLSILRRYTVHLNCMLDADSAGEKAAERMLPMAIAAGLDVKIFPLAGGSDPDSYFSEDFANRFRALESRAMTAMEFLLSRFLPNGNSTPPQEKADALVRIWEVISMAESSIAREGYLDELSSLAGLDRHSVVQDFKSFATKKNFYAPPSQVKRGGRENESKKISSAEGQLLAAILVNGGVAVTLSNALDQPFLQNLSSPEGKVLLKVLNEIVNDGWEGMSVLDNGQLFSDGERNAAYAVVADLEEGCDPVVAASMCLGRLYSDFVKNEIEKINGEIRKISLDEGDAMRTLQENRLSLRKMLRHPPQIF